MINGLSQFGGWNLAPYLQPHPFEGFGGGPKKPQHGFGQPMPFGQPFGFGGPMPFEGGMGGPDKGVPNVGMNVPNNFAQQPGFAPNALMNYGRAVQRY